MVVAVMALFLPLLTTTIDGLGNDRIGGEPGNAANGGSSGMGGSAMRGKGTSKQEIEAQMDRRQEAAAS